MNENLKQNSQTENNGLLATKKMGRPPIEINKKNFESLCGLQCTEEDIADFFECSIDTIERWCKKTYSETFAEVYKKHKAKGRISIRRAQFALAQKNATVAIWLGKQYLGQRDVQVVDATVKDNTPKVDLSQLSRQEILELTQNLYKDEQK